MAPRGPKGGHMGGGIDGGGEVTRLSSNEAPLEKLLRMLGLKKSPANYKWLEDELTPRYTREPKPESLDDILGLPEKDTDSMCTSASAGPSFTQIFTYPVPPISATSTTPLKRGKSELDRILKVDEED